jgi:hypothetical protein
MKEGGFPRGRLLLLPAKIQSEKLPGTNALATASVTKSFKVLITCVNVLNLFVFVTDAEAK